VPRGIGLDRAHHPVEYKADEANHHHRDHDPRQRLFAAVLELVPYEFAEAGVLRQHFGGDQHHPAHTQRKAHTREDIGDRRRQHELGQLGTPRQPQHPANVQ